MSEDITNLVAPGPLEEVLVTAPEVEEPAPEIEPIEEELIGGGPPILPGDILAQNPDASWYKDDPETAQAIADQIRKEVNKALRKENRRTQRRS